MRANACVVRWSAATVLRHYWRCHPTPHPASARTQRYLPHAVEPALGVNRLLLALLCDGLREEAVPAASARATPGASGGDVEPPTRLVFHVHEDLAPHKVAVLPLLKREPMLAQAGDLHAALLRSVAATTDVTQSIGKRYRRQDEVGTPLCVTVDHRSAADGTVSVRCRDTMRQVRVATDELLHLARVGDLRRSVLAPRFDAAEEAAGGV